MGIYLRKIFGRITCPIFVLVILLCNGKSFAAPLVSGTTGIISHGNTITIAGSSFGLKSIAAPVVWDNCDGINILDKWNGGLPDTSGSTYNLGYRTPAQVGRGISLPHSHSTKYLTGAHYPGTSYNNGYNVMIYKNRTVSSYPQYTYASWYQRTDDGWVFGSDDNYKAYEWSRGTSPYDLPNNWYGEYNSRPTSRTSGADWHLNDDDTALGTPSVWGGAATNPMSGVWAKIEIEIRWDTSSSGYVKIWDMNNGKTVSQPINISMKTDSSAWGTARSEGIGGYARMRSANNWRYFADLYLDYSISRVVIGDASTYTNCRIREAQIPSSWSSSSITATVNQGAFGDGVTAYIYVVDSNGVVNTNGYPITFNVNNIIKNPGYPGGMQVQ